MLYFATIRNNQFDIILRVFRAVSILWDFFSFAVKLHFIMNITCINNDLMYILLTNWTIHKAFCTKTKLPTLYLYEYTKTVARQKPTHFKDTECKHFFGCASQIFYCLLFPDKLSLWKMTHGTPNISFNPTNSNCLYKQGL